MNPERRIELTALYNPESVELARWVCLATRIDAALIRRARLSLMRGASAAAESDLWFSPLIQTAGTRYILFYPDVASLLRCQLAENRRNLAFAWRLTRKTHRGLPELVRLEEKINWLALKDDARLEQKLDALLRPLIKAVLMGQREGLGRWALNVLPHMPERARESRSARLLRVVAESQLYGGWANLLTTTGEGPTDEEAALLLHGLGRTSAGLRLVGDRLEVSEPPEEGSRLIRVPTTNPRVLELTWARGDAQEQLRLTWQTGERAHAKGVRLPVTANTLAGDSRRLIHGGEVKRDAPSLVFIGDHNRRPVGLGFLVENNFVLTTLRSIRDVSNPDDPANESVNVLIPDLLFDDHLPARVSKAGAVPEGSTTSVARPLLLKLQGEVNPFSSIVPKSGPAKLKSAFDFVGKVLAAPGLPPYDAPQRWMTFEVGEANEAGEFSLTPATQVKSEDLALWSGAPLIDVGTGDVAGVVLVRDEEGVPRLSLFSLNQITRDFPEIFNTGSTIVVTYSREDRAYVDAFQVRVAAGVGSDGRLSLWDVTEFENGGGWRQDIIVEVDSATAIVMFISADYLASEFVLKGEMSSLIENANSKGTAVVPVIVSPSLFEQTEFARYQAANPPRNPLAGMTSAEREQFFGRLVETLSSRLGVKTAGEETQTEAARSFFISYNKADITWAEWIAWELEEAGYATTVQAWDFRPGVSSGSMMRETLEKVDRVIAILSPDYLEAEFKQTEVAAAFGRDPRGEGQRLIPVRVREVHLTGLFAALNYIDLVGLNEQEARSRLLESIKGVYPQPLSDDAPKIEDGAGVAFPVPAPVPPPPPPPSLEFKTDIFVSYARSDDEPVAEGSQGWVTLFIRNLELRLSQILGYRTNIWLDARSFESSQAVDVQVSRALYESCVLIAIITPSYVRSLWCLGELREFTQRAQQTGGLLIGDRMRIFKVVKTYVERERHPPELQGQLGYEFFEYDSERERAREFSPDRVPELDRRYWNKLYDLAHDIKSILTELKKDATETPAQENEAIYLAETTRDLTVQREQIRRDLQQHGHRVLPDAPLSMYAPEFDASVRESLARCRMSVHLVGTRYGVIPEGGDGRSVAHRQLELAGERAASDKSFRRLIWIPPGLEPADESQRALVHALQYGQDVGAGTELLQVMLEEFKQHMHERLVRTAQVTAPAVNDKGPATIYLICDKEDLDEVRPLVDFLFERGFEVILPATEGDKAPLRKDHETNLIECDAAFIYCGHSSEMWLRYNLLDIIKIDDRRRRTGPLIAKGIYLGPPETGWKQHLRTQRLPVVRNFEAVSPDDLMPLLKPLEPPDPDSFNA